MRFAEDLAAPWRQFAACRGEPTSLWYPERGERSPEADRICAGCPVSEPCRLYGEDESFGIWGGDRASDRREQRREARLTEGCFVCGKPITRGRRRYCSDECALVVVEEAVTAAQVWRDEHPDETQLRLVYIPALATPFAACLIDERRSREIDEETAARLCRVTPARYRSWEIGRILPSEEHVRALSAFLGASVRHTRVILEMDLRRPRSSTRTSPNQPSLFDAHKPSKAAVG